MAEEPRFNSKAMGSPLMEILGTALAEPREKLVGWFTGTGVAVSSWPPSAGTGLAPPTRVGVGV